MLLILCIWSLLNVVCFFSLDRKLESLERQRAIVKETIFGLMEGGKMISKRTLKLCPKCEELKLLLTEFSIDPHSPDNYFDWCNKCRNIYYHGDKEKIRVEQYKDFLNKHPGYMEKYNKEYRETHKEHQKELCRKYYINHKDNKEVKE